jgi:hypothetical protein
MKQPDAFECADALVALSGRHRRDYVRSWNHRARACSAARRSSDRRPALTRPQPVPFRSASPGIDWSTSTSDRSSCTGKTVADGRKIATRVKNLRSGILFVSLHYRTSNRLRPLALSSVHSQSLACSARWARRSLSTRDLKLARRLLRRHTLTSAVVCPSVCPNAIR